MKCAQCETEFETSHPTRKYCTPKCRLLAFGMRHGRSSADTTVAPSLNDLKEAKRHGLTLDLVVTAWNAWMDTDRWAFEAATVEDKVALLFGRDEGTLIRGQDGKLYFA